MHNLPLTWTSPSHGVHSLTFVAELGYVRMLHVPSLAWHRMASHGTAWHCMASHGIAWHRPCFCIASAGVCLLSFVDWAMVGTQMCQEPKWNPRLGPRLKSGAPALGFHKCWRRPIRASRTSALLMGFSDRTKHLNRLHE